MTATYRRQQGSKVYTFKSLADLMAKATPERSGDALAGVCAQSAAERVVAQMALSELPLKTFLNEAVIPYESDDITRLIIDTHDLEAFKPIEHLTVGDFRNWLLSEEADGETLAKIRQGLTPEMVAAVSKIMRNQDLILVAKKCQVVTAFRNTIGLPSRLSTRLQPNHPTDSLNGIAATIFDGLMYGNGDAVIGINPATDNVPQAIKLMNLMDEVIQHYQIPTQSCVLTHVTNTIEAIEMGAPVDLVFQSIGGTQGTNDTFGIDLSILKEAHEAALSLNRGSVGNNVMYFETGQGTALSANAFMGSINRLVKPVLMLSRNSSILCWLIQLLGLLALSICLMANRSFVLGLKIISVGSCLVYLWVAISVTPIMPMPIRMTWITC